MRARGHRLALGGALVWASPVAASQLGLSPAELCAHADAVLVGEVTAVETRWAEGPAGEIERRAFVLVERVWAGSAPETVEVVLPGGSLDGLTLWVEHVPELRVDRPYALFLARRPDGAWGVVGGEAGAHPLKPSPAAREPQLAALRGAIGTCRGR